MREKDTQIKTKRERERWIKRRVERSSAEGERERGKERLDGDEKWRRKEEQP